MKLGLMIVLYNKKLEDSRTFLKLKNEKLDYDFLIVDNSTSDFGNEKFCKNLNISYLSMNGNVGLSVAYNKGYEYFSKTNIDYVVLFDDDSQTSDDFFTQLEKSIKRDPTQVYVPLVYDQNDNLKGPTGHSNVSVIKIIYRKLIPLTLERIQKMESSNALAGINSGMAIPRNVFSKYKYDEKIFLDCVDWKFCDDMQKKDIKISKFNGVLFQDFHFNEKKFEITKGKHNRLVNRKKDLWNYSKKKYLFYLSYIILLDLINSGNLRYLKYFFIKS
ncbi:MAG: glycosyltransferase [Mycoplasmatales bacterium]